MADTPAIGITPKDPETKTFSFSKEELDFLTPRQGLINQHRLEIADTDFVMQQYIVNSVVPRLGIKIDDYHINFNVNEGKLSCVKKPPQIIKPTDGIVVPK